jgi:hypothetical protein
VDGATAPEETVWHLRGCTRGVCQIKQQSRFDDRGHLLTITYCDICHRAEWCADFSRTHNKASTDWQ